MGMKTIGRFVYDSTSAQDIAAGGAIPFTSSTVSTDCIRCDGSSISIARCGVYEVLANFTFEALAAGEVETQMYRGGNAVPGAHAIDTVAAADDYVSQAFHAVVTVPKEAPLTTLNFKAADATSLAISNVIVIKVA